MLRLALLIWLALCGFAQAQTNCQLPAQFPGTPVISSAQESGHVLKASPGCLMSVYITPQSTAGFLLVFNSLTVPGDGAVTPQDCIQVPASITASANWAPQPSEWFSVGIAVAFSTTGCFTKTASATAFFHALIQ